VSELVALRWDQVDFKAGVLQVVRRKSGTPSTHPLRGPEIRALRRLRREQQDGHGGVYVFTTKAAAR
jgi:integrase